MTAGDIITVKGSTASRKAAAFDGTDDYILADAHAVARVAANDTVGTYSAWVYMDADSGTDRSILSAGDNDSANEFFVFSINSTSSVLRARLSHGGATQFDVKSSLRAITPKKWTHVAVVQNGTQPKFYVNGENVATTNATATDLTYWYDELTLTDKFAIGVKESNNTHTDDFAGMISDVKYWNIALNATEVLADKNGETLDKDAAYLQLHLLDGDNGITDQGLGADNGTLTGHAYLCGEGSEWSRRLDGSALVADDINTITYPGGAMTTIVKAA
jgi:hypothetical protein